MITVYGKPGCIYCDMAKKYLETKGVAYEYTDITTNEKAMISFNQNGFKTVPQIWEGDKHIGGFDQLMQEKI